MQRIFSKISKKNVLIIVLGLLLLVSFALPSDTYGTHKLDPTEGHKPPEEGGDPVDAGAKNTGGADWSWSELPYWLIYGIPYGVFYISQKILELVLAVVGYFLNNIFTYNVILNPNNMPVVQEGWGLLRDIANGFFILIILWIAFTIIFDIEQYGGKKLLVRVILIALLINFSLALVSVVFGLANQLALPFQEKIYEANGGDLAGLIAAKTKLATLNQVGTSAGAEAYRQSIQGAGGGECGFSALTTNTYKGKKCLGGSTATAFATGVAGTFSSALVDNAPAKLTMAMGINVVFLALIIAALIGACVILLERIIAMVFLGITAPIAFLAIVIPHKTLNQMWDQWLQKLFCWAFVAPAFYFLFYLSLRILDITSRAGPPAGAVGFAADILNMIPLLVFLGFLWASIIVGKKMGCTAAGAIAVDLAKKVSKAAVVGAGVATGVGAGAAIAGVAGSLGKRGEKEPEGRIERGMQRLSNRPVLGKVFAPVTRTYEKSRNYFREQISKHEQEAEKGNQSADSLINQMGTSITSTKQLGTARALFKKQGGLDRLIDRKGNKYVESLVETAGRYGDTDLQQNLLKRFPGLIKQEHEKERGAISDQDALDKIIKRMSAEEVGGIDWKQVAPDRQQALLEAIAKTKNQEHMRRFWDGFDKMKPEDQKNWEGGVQNAVAANRDFAQASANYWRNHYDHFEADAIAKDIEGTTLAIKKIGGTQALLRKNKANLIKDGEIDTLINQATEHGLTEFRSDLLKRFPSHIKQAHVAGATSDLDALQKFVADMNAEETGRIDWKRVAPGDNAMRKEIVKNLLYNGTPEHLRQINDAILRLQKTDKDGWTGMINSEISNNKTFWDEFRRENPANAQAMERFLASPAGRRVSIIQASPQNPPPTGPPPQNSPSPTPPPPGPTNNP